LSIKINAQPQYKSCLDGMARWSILCEIYDWPPYSVEIFTYGDTIINGIVYKNIMEESSISDFEETNINWKNHIPDLYDQYTGEYSNLYIRESNDASQLYLLDTSQNKEYLIFDLNLQEGDKFKVPEIWDYLISKDSVTVDSVYTKNELKHIRFDQILHLPGIGESWNYKLTFIEGVGPNMGFINFYRWQAVNCFQNQSLFYKNELIFWYYKNGLISCPCGYASQGDAIQTISLSEDYILQIEDNYLKIHFSTNKNRQIAIYDVSGRLQYNQNFSSGKETAIPTASFPKGIYLLKLYNKDNNQLNIHKIIL
jgi:hypothetical protein